MNRRPTMLTREEEEDVLAQAYVPEHLLPLMGAVSKGEPFLLDDYLGFASDNWLIVVGYPLRETFSQDRCGKVLREALEQHRPEYLWFAGPEIPATLLSACRERESDQHYRLDLEQTSIKGSLERKAEKASLALSIERGRGITKEHERLVAELMKREVLPPRIRELYHAMPEYVRRSPSAWVLSARDRKGRLSAFFVIELAARKFSTYVLGAHSKKNYVPHASDLLFLDMIRLTREHGKTLINLGLGVNEGIRRFKEKWGGAPFLKYEFCECSYPTTRAVSLIKSLGGKL